MSERKDKLADRFDWAWRLGPSHGRCSGTTARGESCKRSGDYGGLCYQHHPEPGQYECARDNLKLAVKALVILAAEDADEYRIRNAARMVRQRHDRLVELEEPTHA